VTRLFAIMLLLALSLAASAQPVMRKLAVLSPANAYNPVEVELDRRLAAAGWVAGKNFTRSTRRAAGRNDQLPALAAELAGERPDAIVAFGTPASFAARAATTTIPIVFVSVGDPVGVGLVPSLARPGGNITGISGLTLALTAKRLELLRELIPGMRNVALLLNPSDVTAERMAQAALAGAKRLNLKVDVFRAQEPAQLSQAFQAIKRSGVSAVLLQPDGMFWTYRDDIAKLAAASGLPAMYAFQEHVEAGGLMSYGASFSGGGGMLAKCVEYVDRIFRGAKPADLPIQEPTDFDFLINQKAAKALGLAIPQALAVRASRIIE
jgi:putative ABC transport system substrate-binding protein